MSLHKFKLVNEAEDSYHICSPDGKAFTIPKDKLSNKAHDIIKTLSSDKPQQFSKGGNVQLENQEKEKAEEVKQKHNIQNADNVILKSFSDRSNLDDSKTQKNLKVRQQLIEPEKFFDGTKELPMDQTSKDFLQELPDQPITPGDPTYVKAMALAEKTGHPWKTQGEFNSNLQTIPNLSELLPNKPLDMVADQQKIATPVIQSALVVPTNTEQQDVIEPKQIVNNTPMIQNDTLDPYKSMQDALKQQMQAAENKGISEKQVYDNLIKNTNESQVSQEDIRKRSKEADDKFLKMMESDDNKIDPNRLWNKASTGNKILAGIGMLLSGIGSGLTGQPNMALKVIDGAIDRDIDAQKNDQSRKMNLWKMNKESLKDDLAATLTTKNQFLTIAQFQLSKAASQFNSDTAKAQYKMAMSQAEQMKQKNNELLALISPTKESTQGKGNTEEGYLNHANALGMVDKSLSEKAMKNYLPGVGATRLPASEKDRDLIASSNSTKAGLSELQALATLGPTIPGSSADSINKTKMAALQLEMKNAYQLGVLSQSDMDMLNKLVADPGSIRTDKSIEQLEATKQSINNRLKSVYDKLGVIPFAKSTTPLNNEALQWAKQNPNDPRSTVILKKLGM